MNNMTKTLCRPKWIFLPWEDVADLAMSFYRAGMGTVPGCARKAVLEHTRGQKTTQADIKISVSYVCSLLSRRRSTSPKESQAALQLELDFSESAKEVL